MGNIDLDEENDEVSKNSIKEVITSNDTTQDVEVGKESYEEGEKKLISVVQLPPRKETVNITSVQITLTDLLMLKTPPKWMVFR